MRLTFLTIATVAILTGCQNYSHSTLSEEAAVATDSNAKTFALYPSNLTWEGVEERLTFELKESVVTLAEDGKSATVTIENDSVEISDNVYNPSDHRVAFQSSDFEHTLNVSKNGRMGTYDTYGNEGTKRAYIVPADGMADTMIYYGHCYRVMDTREGDQKKTLKIAFTYFVTWNDRVKSGWATFDGGPIYEKTDGDFVATNSINFSKESYPLVEKNGRIHGTADYHLSFAVTETGLISGATSLGAPEGELLPFTFDSTKVVKAVKTEDR